MPFRVRISASLVGGGLDDSDVHVAIVLGFDHLEQMLERASKTSSDGYPPYNIEQVSPTGLRITLAVAGFTMETCRSRRKTINW